MNERMTHKTRRRMILGAALALAKKSGYFDLTRDKVAVAAGCSCGLVQYHFNTIGDLKVALIEEANRRKDLSVLSQLVGTLDPNESLVDPELVEPALKFIRKRAR